MTRIAFRKMHGLGNDFVVLDQRRDPRPIGAAEARALADRHTGIGCDQVLLLEPPRDPRAQVFMRILNPDGSEAEACGNGARCVAWLLMRESGRDSTVIDTPAGLIEAHAAGDGVAVDMGAARTGWREIPLAQDVDTLHLPIALEGLADPVGVSMGNPHAVFFVPDAEAVDLRRLGPLLEHHPLFPARANIEIAQVLAPARIRMRVWERGAGITRACGTGACATLVAAARRGLAQRRAELLLDGGPLTIEWRSDGHVIMTGPVALAYSGTLPASLLP